MKVAGDRGETAQRVEVFQVTDRRVVPEPTYCEVAVEGETFITGGCQGAQLFNRSDVTNMPGRPDMADILSAIAAALNGER